MKKYLNKALQFQWFYLAKPAILAVLLIFSIATYILLLDGISTVSNNMAYFSSNVVTFDTSIFAIVLAISLFIIYFFSKGIDKRNKMYFITSGPFNKKEVLINELISLFIILGVFISITFYVGGCLYIANREFISITVSYWPSLMLLALRLFMFGAGIIVFMELFDVLFSNSIMAFTSLVAVPLMVYFGVVFTNIYLYNFIKSSFSSAYYIVSLVEKAFETLFTFMTLNYFEFARLEEQFRLENAKDKFYIGFVLAVIIIIVGYVILSKLYNKIKLEEIGKLFTFKWVEKIYIFIVSYVVGIYGANVVLDIFMVSRMGTAGKLIFSLSIGLIVYLITRKIGKYIFGLMS